jgi:hypothetical protein
VQCTVQYCTTLYYTVLYCTICIITLHSEGFLQKHATSSQLLHTVTLYTASSHHKSNYLRCYCLTVSFKINKLFFGSTHAHARTHTRTTVPAVLYHTAAGAVPAVQYNVTDTHGTISLRTLLVQTIYALPLFVHDIQFLMDLDPLKMDIMFRCKVGDIPPPATQRRIAEYRSLGYNDAST